MEIVTYTEIGPKRIWEASASGVSSPIGEPFPGPGLRTQIAASTGRGYTVWRKDGREILFADHAALWSVTVQKAGSGLQTLFGPPAG